MNTHFVSLVEKKQLSQDVYEFTFCIHIQNDFNFRPGQYIWLILYNVISTDKRGTRRAFSIVSSTKQKRSITIILKPSDSAYKRALFNLPVGGRASIVGPLGSAYTITDNTSQNIVFVSGGIGIAPFMSIIRSRELYPNHKFTFIYSSSSIESSIYLKELQQLSKIHKIRLITHTGYIDESAFPGDLDYLKSEFFICGSYDFVNTIDKILLKKQVSHKQMRFEQFYPTFPFNLTEEYFKHKSGDVNILLQALQDADHHVIITDANGIILFANNKAQQTTGYTFEEMKGNTPRLWGGMHSPEFYRELWKRKIEPKGFVCEITNRKKDGTFYNVIAHISPIFTKDKTVIGFIGTEEDITNKITYQKQLEDQNKVITTYKNKFEAIISSIADGVIVLDMNKKVILLNQAAITILGSDSINYLNRDFVSVCRFVAESNEYCIPTNCLIELIYKDFRYSTLEKCIYICKSDNTKIPIAYKATPYNDSEGKVQGYVILFRRIN
jgi:PAS domain S-box-containing protein